MLCAPKRSSPLHGNFQNARALAPAQRRASAVGRSGPSRGRAWDPVAHGHVVRLGRQGSEGGVSARWWLGLPSAGTRCVPSAMLAPGAGRAGRPGLGCGEGRGTGTRVSAGSAPAPTSHKRRRRFRLLG